MKVAIVSQPIDSVLPPEQTSVGIWTYQTARMLAARGHVVVVFCPRARTDPRRTVLQDGVMYRFIWPGPSRLRRRLENVANRHSRDDRRPAYARWWSDAIYAAMAAWESRRHGVDVIHVQNWTSLVPVIRLFNPNTVVGLHMHCDWLSQLDCSLMKRRIDAVDIVIGCSQHVVDKARHAFARIEGEKFAVIPNGVDTSHFGATVRPDDGQTRILFVGRISPEKGVHDLIAAMELVVAMMPNVSLDVVGRVGAAPLDRIVKLSGDPLVSQLHTWYDGDYGKLLEATMSDDVARVVTFHGPVAHDEVVEAMHRCDLLVNPSYSESFGMSLVEAMSCGRAVIATSAGGMPTVVRHGVDGLLVEVGDVRQLAAAIVELARDSDRRTAMGLAGRARAEDQFSWTAIAATTEKRYESVQRRDRGRHPASRSNQRTAGCEQHTPRVSVGLPVFNGSQFLEAAVESILGQSFTDLELIISDNGSTDETPAICSRYAASDSRVRYVRSESNLGASWNFNRVLELARGEYFKWAAHDDLVHPEFIARAVDCLDQDDSAVLCYSRVCYIGADGSPLDEYTLRLATDDPDPVRRFAQLHLESHRCFDIFGLIRRDVLGRLPPMGSYSHADGVLLERLALRGRFVELPDVLFFSRRHDDQSMVKFGTFQQGPIDYRGYAAWFDPEVADRLVFPYWRMLWEDFTTVVHGDLRPIEQVRAHVQLVRGAYRMKRSMLTDLVVNGRTVWRKACDRMARGQDR